MAKISIEQIAAWPSGKLITEKMLVEVFTLIGTVINMNDTLLTEAIQRIAELKIASRWVGVCETYSGSTGIEAFVSAHRNDDRFNPEKGNKPLPSVGDTIFVKNNADDPNLPVGTQPGQFIYIYSPSYTIQPDGSYIEQGGKWELYNPFSLPTANETTDGLMTKDQYVKLRDLPNRAEYNDNLTRVKTKLDNHEERITGIEEYNKKQDSNHTALAQRVTAVEQNKQDKATDIIGLDSKTVEGNLQELTDKYKIYTEQEITIWQPETPVSATSTYADEYYSIELPFTTTPEKMLRDSYAKAYVTIRDETQPGVEHDVAFTFKIIENVDGSITNVTTESLSFGPVTLYTAESTAYIEQVNTTNYKLHVFIKTEKNLGSGVTYKAWLNKVIKDTGVSDYMLAEVVIDNVSDFLKKSLGVKKQLITQRQSGNYNGFRKGDVLKLNFTYFPNANALELYLGGTKLTPNVEWEEVAPNEGTPFASSIKFLQDIDIDKEGAIEIIGLSLILNSYQIKIWDATTQWVKTDVCYYRGKMWVALANNVNVIPGSNDKIWTLLQFEIDLKDLEDRIRAYMQQIVGQEVANQIDTYQKGSSVYHAKNTLSEFLSSDDFAQHFLFLVKNGAYTINENGEKHLINTQEQNTLTKIVYQTPERTFYLVKWLDTIYATNLADVTVLHATENEIQQGIKKELADYEQGMEVEFAGETHWFKDLDDFEQYKQSTGLTDDDFEDVEFIPDLEDYVKKSELKEQLDPIKATIDVKADASQVSANYLNKTATGTQTINGSVTINNGIVLKNSLAASVSSGTVSFNANVSTDGLTITTGRIIAADGSALLSENAANLTQYAKLDKANKFTLTNTFNNGVNVNGNYGVYFKDNNGKESLNIFSNGTRNGITYFTQFGENGNSTQYYLRYGGPQENNDLVNKKYVDDKVAQGGGSAIKCVVKHDGGTVHMPSDRTKVEIIFTSDENPEVIQAYKDNRFVYNLRTGGNTESGTNEFIIMQGVETLYESGSYSDLTISAYVENLNEEPAFALVLCNFVYW